MPTQDPPSLTPEGEVPCLVLQWCCALLKTVLQSLPFSYGWPHDHVLATDLWVEVLGGRPGRLPAGRYATFCLYSSFKPTSCFGGQRSSSHLGPWSDLEDANHVLGTAENGNRRLNHGESPHSLRLPTPWLPLQERINPPFSGPFFNAAECNS